MATVIGAAFVIGLKLGESTKTIESLDGLIKRVTELEKKEAAELKPDSHQTYFDRIAKLEAHGLEQDRKIDSNENETRRAQYLAARLPVLIKQREGTPEFEEAQQRLLTTIELTSESPETWSLRLKQRLEKAGYYTTMVVENKPSENGRMVVFSFDLEPEISCELLGIMAEVASFPIYLFAWEKDFLGEELRGSRPYPVSIGTRDDSPGVNPISADVGTIFNNLCRPKIPESSEKLVERALKLS